MNTERHLNTKDSLNGTSKNPLANTENRLSVAEKSSYSATQNRSTLVSPRGLNRGTRVECISEDEKLYIVYTMMCLQAFNNTAYVQQTPFVPLLARKSGVNPQYVGYIFATMAITQVLT